MMLKFPLLCFLATLLLFGSCFFYGDAAMMFAMYIQHHL